MPIINGQKMACEPCIRGHRSTKCNHASERLMVPVRKPGRPLSICPHPAGKPCGCGGITAAIARRQKCSCGTAGNGESWHMSHEKRSDTPPQDNLASSPTAKSTPASYRVQKPPKPAPRKMSFDPANLERVGPSQFNLLSQFSPSEPSHRGSSSDMAVSQPPPRLGDGYAAATPLAPSYNSLYTQSQMYPVYPQPLVMPLLNPSSNEADALAENPETNSQIDNLLPSTPNPVFSNGHEHQQQVPMAANVSPVRVTNGVAKQPGRSCCGSNGVATTKAALSTPNGDLTSLETAPMELHPQQYPAFYPPTQMLFTYPPHYGSYLQPLLPEQWKQTMDALQLAQAMPQGQMAPPNTTFAPNGGSNGTPDSMPVSHLCSCGDSCQCIGCAAHPYNDATRDYVRSAWNVVLDDVYGSGGTGPTSQSGGIEGEAAADSATLAGATATIPPGANGTAAASRNGNGNGAGSCCGPKVSSSRGGTPISPLLAPPTPASDAASGTSDEQTLSASDFFFVTYPFGSEECVGESGSCPCGDDCMCIGCAVHGKPIAFDGDMIQPLLPEQGQFGHDREQQQQQHDQQEPPQQQYQIKLAKEEDEEESKFGLKEPSYLASSTKQLPE